MSRMVTKIKINDEKDKLPYSGINVILVHGIELIPVPVATNQTSV